jgi:quercetin dioxygenase-like cupin family protein
MNINETATLFSNGTIEFEGQSKSCCDLPWNQHPTFKGVALKNLLCAAETDGGLSSHIVKIEPGCTLEEHIHEAQWELHEVISGQGTANLSGKKMNYSTGRMTVIPKGCLHSVTAGENGLVILAKFFPGAS